MRLILMISSLRRGGAEHTLSRIASIYYNRGYKVTVITLEDSGDDPIFLLDHGIEWIVLPIERKNYLIAKIIQRIKRLFKLRNILKVRKPLVLLSFMTPTNILAIAATWRLGVRCIVSERTNPALYDYGWIINIFRNSCYRLADTIVVQTKQIADWLRLRTKGNMVIIPNFLLRETPKDEFGFRQHHIIAVGRLAPEKCFDLLITAFARIASDFPYWKIFILGEGPERQTLQTLIEQFSLQQRVMLCGFVEQPAIVLQRASVVVQPSRFEGFPNALLEAMAYGLPAIATHEAGNMLIKEQVNGLLIPVDNIEALVSALQQLIQNPQLREKLGEAAMQVRETYGERQVMKLWDEVLFSGQTIE
jgi:glycosyltransferase involved in cell wall biosynthesis